MGFLLEFILATTYIFANIVQAEVRRSKQYYFGNNEVLPSTVFTEGWGFDMVWGNISQNV